MGWSVATHGLTHKQLCVGSSGNCVLLGWMVGDDAWGQEKPLPCQRIVLSPPRAALWSAQVRNCALGWSGLSAIALARRWKRLPDTRAHRFGVRAECAIAAFSGFKSGVANRRTPRSLCDGERGRTRITGSGLSLSTYVRCVFPALAIMASLTEPPEMLRPENRRESLLNDRADLAFGRFPVRRLS